VKLDVLFKNTLLKIYSKTAKMYLDLSNCIGNYSKLIFRHALVAIFSVIDHRL